MLMSLHSSALYEILVSEPVDVFNTPLSHSRIAITQAILEEYEEIFNVGVSERDLYRAFIQGMSSRLKSVRPLTVEGEFSLLGDYFSAARSGGRYLCISKEQFVCEASAEKFMTWGVRVGVIPNIFEASANNGFKPFESHYLSHNANNRPDAIFRYFKDESRVTVYDRYFNQDSLGFINASMAEAGSDCSLVLLTSRDCAMTLGEIRKEILLSRSQSLSLFYVDEATRRRVHDRHIFISSDVEIHFTRGVDCFGRPPNWINKNGAVHVYDSTVGSIFSFGLQANGANVPRPIRVSSCVIR